MENINVGGASSFILFLCVVSPRDNGSEILGFVTICRQTFVKGLEPFVKWLEEAEEEE